ncbi:MAG: insulinase family protein [Ruminococcaceae bacterium]|nr:insulinase family protein [Oscillospiraceae bacterium]
MKLNEYTRIGERVYFERLENGLGFFYVQKLSFHQTYAMFATNYGGADRRFRLNGEWIDTPAGVAHFLEHKMFDMPDGNALTDLSMNGANPNAFTSTSMTAYHFECTDRFWENLEILLRFVSTPYFTPESVEKEQGIIGQEIRMTEDDPEYSLYYGLMKLLYKYNPARDSVAGTVESISEITAETLENCFKVFYNPNNMVLCVVGDQDPERVIETAKNILTKYRGIVPERDYGKKESLKPTKQYSERIMEVGMPMFMMGAKDGAALKGNDYLKRELTAELALELLAGKSSPLYSKLYSDGLINASFSADYESVAGQSFVVIGGESRDPKKAYAEISLAAARMGMEGVDEKAFNRQKKAAIGKKLRSLNDFDSIAYSTARGYFMGYDPFNSLEILETITADEVTAFISGVFAPERLALSVVKND